MAQITITEGLAEIKTIGKRLDKKRQGVLQYLARDSRLKDPMESDGGSAAFITSERQSISDLEKRIVAIRTAIQKVNLATITTVGDTTMTVAEWLTFRREVSAGKQQFLALLGNSVKSTRDKVQREGGKVIANVAAVADGGGTKQAIEVIINLDEKALLAEQDNLEKILGDLDGKLSLLNATTTIEV